MSHCIGKLGMSLLLLVSARQLGAQEYKSPVWGGTGGTASYDLDCGPGAVMVGVFGKVGQWIDSIGLTCQTVKADGTLGSTFTRGPKGGDGGVGKDARCSAGKVVGSVAAHTGTYIDGFVINCYPWSAASKHPDYGAAREGPIMFGRWAWTVNAVVKCPTEKAGKALRGKYGWYIDSMQFACDDYDK